MKKILPLIFVLFASLTIVYAENTDSPQTVFLEDSAIYKEDSFSSMIEETKEPYNLEVVDINKIEYLFREPLTKTFKKDSVWEDVHLWGAYNGDWSMIFKEEGSIQNHYEFNALSLGSDWRLKDNKADFRFMVNYSPLSGRNVMRNIFSDVYAGTDKIPHHRLQIGHFRPGVGMEGKSSSYLLPFITRSQISKNFSSVRKIGGRVTGDYSLAEYDIGVYSSDTYFKSFFPGAEFDAWINFKPLGKTDGRYGNLKLGGGIQNGHRHHDYTVTGAYAEYNYKNLMLNFEWANADGYNGYLGHSSTHAGGFYTTASYRITPKLQILARYDEYDPNKNIKHNNMRQYWFGINYFIKGSALKLILDYVFCQNDSAKDSHKIILGLQILF